VHGPELAESLSLSERLANRERFLAADVGPDAKELSLYPSPT